MPTATVRGRELASSQSSFTIDLTVDSTCTGFKYLAMYVSKGGTGALGEIDDITSDNAGFTGWSVVPYSGHGSAYITGVASGPRAGWLVVLEGDVEAGDTLTITMQQSCEEWSVFLIDEAGAKATDAIIHVYPTTSLGNASAQTVFHQGRAHADNSVRGMLWTGGGSNAVTPDEGTTIDSWTNAVGISAGNIVGKDGADFTGHKIDWSWSGTWSNQGIVWEVEDAASDGGATARIELIEAVFDTSGTWISGAFTPEAGDVIAAVVLFERTPPTQPTSVQDNQGTPAAYTLVSPGATDAQVDPDGSHRGHVYSRRYATSPGSITLTYSHTSISGSSRFLFRIKGAQGTGHDDWAGAVVVATAAAATALTSLNLGTLGVHSGVLLAAMADASTEDFDFEDGLVPLNLGDAAGLGSETECLLVLWHGDDANPTPTFSVAGSARDLAGIAIEVLGAAVAATKAPVLDRDHRLRHLVTR